MIIILVGLKVGQEKGKEIVFYYLLFLTCLAISFKFEKESLLTVWLISLIINRVLCL